MTSPDARLDRSISIHALREEGDFGIRPERQRVNLFLSTPSARRATTSSKNKRTNDKNFYPRPPRGGRRGEFCRAGKSYGISIHALREEGDNTLTSCERSRWKFLSTPSARRATKLPPRKRSSQKNFYPRPPRGGRLQRQLLWHLQERFLSTPSARRATRRSPSSHRKTAISIHALREEGDLVPLCRAGDHQAISIHALREEGDGD